MAWGAGLPGTDLDLGQAIQFSVTFRCRVKITLVMGGEGLRTGDWSVDGRVPTARSGFGVQGRSGRGAGAEARLPPPGGAAGGGGSSPHADSS